MSLADRLKKAEARVLTIDIENSPNVVHAWGLFDQNIGMSQIQEVGRVFSFAAKWYGEKDVLFYSDYHDTHEVMVQRAHDLLSEADFVIGYNSKGFDMKHLHREFILSGLTPPKPYKNIDLLLIARSKFKFLSNKLDFVAQQLGLGGKTQHSGHQLWVDCMANDPKAWALMKKYNKQDVVLTEKLFDKLRPWITNMPHIGQYIGETHCCPNCGSAKLTAAGIAYANVTSYDQYQCGECGAWSRSTVKLKNQPDTRMSTNS